ncbi:MAG: acyl-CoA dehydrogenase family protein [Dehalococcoidia bacterium]|jgi:alkylation response protein AidB-like acyl-CoA dehydrogenase|nr:acyl-CoA dehydrogenase family protein [Dehalococcoidia bacterium]
MDFRFTAEEERFREEVRQFLDRELPPGWDEEFDMETEAGVDALWEFARQLQRKLGQRRWLALAWPPEHGGLGAPIMHQVIFNEEMGRRRAPLLGLNMGVYWVGPAIMLYGSPWQKERFLPKIASGEEVWCTLYSEPGAGSDLASLQTRAVLEGDEWVINGQKIWSSMAHRADWGYLAARTDPDAPKHKGISTFLVPMKAPGIIIRPLINMAGHHGFNQVFFENVRIPKDYLVGEVNRGWYQVAVTLDFERSSISGVARSEGYYEAILGLVREERHLLSATGREAARLRLAEVGIEIEVGRYLSYRVASLQQQGRVPNYEASIAKLYASELAQRLARVGMDVLGLYGQLQPKSRWAKLRGRVERYYLTSVAETIGGGTSEIQRNVIAVRGLGLPRG